MKNILPVLLLLFLACNSIPESYQNVLVKAGSNRTELEKVVAHYDSVGNAEKLKAAYFLIGNMEDRYFWDGDIVTDFDSIFGYLDCAQN